MRSPQWNGLRRICAAMLRPAHRESHAAVGGYLRVFAVSRRLQCWRRAGRCVAMGPSRCRLVDVLCLSPPRTGPASTTVPSTVRSSPSESVDDSCGRSRAAAPSPRTTRPAGTTAPPTAATQCAARESRHAAQQAPPEPVAISTKLGRSQTNAPAQSQPQTARPHGTAEWLAGGSGPSDA